MSVRNALLALVSQRPAGVYRLKQAFEDQTGGAWPLNIGQVYQTMQRLERDGLVTSHPETNAGRDSEVFVLTDEGDAELESWWNHPVPRGRAERDELVMKLAVAATDDSVDLSSVIQQQRRATMQALRDLTRLKGTADGTEVAWRLILERHIFDLESELRWLDRVEGSPILSGARKGGSTRGTGAPRREDTRVGGVDTTGR